MIRRRPDLIVPIRDRRQHRRLLTFRNIRNVTLIVLVIFAFFTIRSERRDTTQQGEYGRLYGNEVGHSTALRQVQVVPEAPPVDDQVGADPMLVAPAAREQWLHDQPTQAAAAIEPVIATTAVPADVRGGDSRVAIVGGPEGVSVVQERRQRPLLRGGFGR